MFASVLAATSTCSALAGTGVLNAFAAGKANDDIAVNVNLSVVSEDTIGIDLYAKLDEDVKDPVLVYENENSGEDEVSVKFVYNEVSESYKAHIPVSVEKIFDTYNCRIESDGKVIQEDMKYSVAEYAMEKEYAMSETTGSFIY